MSCRVGTGPRLASRNSRMQEAAPPPGWAPLVTLPTAEARLLRAAPLPLCFYREAGSGSDTQVVLCVQEGLRGPAGALLRTYGAFRALEVLSVLLAAYNPGAVRFLLAAGELLPTAQAIGRRGSDRERDG